MRTLIAGALLATACTSPRTKDCNDLQPMLDEAKAARTLASNLGDAGLAQTKLAERPKRAAESLRGAKLRDEAMKAPVFRLVDAMDRYGAAMASLDELLTALKLRPGGVGGAADVQRSIDEGRPHVERLVQRCVSQDKPFPECVDLRTALERCISPDNDTITAEEQLLTCAAAVEKVKSSDPQTNDSIANVARTIRALEPFARSVGAPAKEAIAIATKLSPKVGAQTAARSDAEKAEAEIRVLCANR